MAADYAHRADQAHARKLERAAALMDTWAAEDVVRDAAADETPDTYDKGA